MMKSVHDKSHIRTMMLKRREALHANDISEYSRRICETVLKIDVYRKAQKIMLYLPIRNEVDTTLFVEEALQSKIVLLPYVDGTLQASRISDIDTLVPGEYGTREPRIRHPEGDIDLVIVPGLAFDESRNRIGFGKGHYDRFLATTDAFKIGLAYDFQITDIPTEPHDIPMDLVITEERTI